MKKVIKITNHREMALSGEFIRFNHPPLYPFPDDVVIRWIGQNEEFGIIEVFTNKDKELEEGLKLMPSMKELDYDTSYLPSIEKEEVGNMAYGAKKDKVLEVINKYK